MNRLNYFRFQPDAMNYELLKELFIGEDRNKKLEKLIKDINQSVEDGIPRHFLIIGHRGIGKTHFLSMLYYSLLENEKIVPIKYAEEEYSIYRVSDLFLRMYELESFGDLFEHGNMDDDDIVKYMISYFNDKNKQYIMMVENLDQIIGDQFDKKEVRKLRSVLQTENTYTLVGSAPMIFSEMSDSKEPFFNFFDIISLNELKKEEIKKLLIKIAELEKNEYLIKIFNEIQYKVDAIITLTGGNPRIALLLYGLISENNIVDVEQSFLKILDESTPYYQDIFRMLSSERKTIFDALISLNRPALPSEIIKMTRLNPANIYSQLRRLENDGYVTSHKIGKNTKYEVREKLFRLWREVRRNPFGINRLSIILQFLELYYNISERKYYFIDCLKNDFIDENSYKEAQYWLLSIPEERKPDIFKELITETIDINVIINYYNVMYDERFSTDQVEDFVNYIVYNDKYQELYDSLNKVDSIELSESMIYLISFLNNKLEGPDSAIKYIDDNINLSPTSVKLLQYKLELLRESEGSVSEIRSTVNQLLDLGEVSPNILNEKALEYYSDQNYGQAIHYLKEALSLDPNHYPSYVGLGLLHDIAGEPEEALKYIDKSLELENDVNTIHFKLKIMKDLKKMDELEAYYELVTKEYPKNQDLIRDYSSFLYDQQKIEDSINVLINMLNITKENISEIDIRILNDISIRYEEIGNLDMALNYSREAYNINPTNGYALTQYLNLLMENELDEEFNQIMNEMKTIDLDDIKSKPINQITVDDIIDVMTIKLFGSQYKEALNFLDRIGEAEIFNFEDGHNFKSDMYAVNYYQLVYGHDSKINDDEFTYYIGKYFESAYAYETVVDEDRVKKLDRLISLLRKLIHEKKIDRMNTVIEKIHEYESDPFWVEPYEVAITVVNTGRDEELLSLSDELREIARAIVDDLSNS